MPKYIFVTGGVVSSVGKGIVSASLGRALKARGHRVSILKLDPYINVDPGTMSPYQHGEVFVTDDGAETDLDLGHYERFLDENLTSANSTSSGQVYEEVIRKERRGDFLGGTIQAIPHVTTEIKRRIKIAGQALDADIVIVEVGGTVGDMEGQPFLEAISQMLHELGKTEAMSVHVTLLPYIGSTQELKTKPTQHSVRELRSYGIQPDVIVTRSDFPVSLSLRDKVSLFCNVEVANVIPLVTATSIYEVPLEIEEAGFSDIVARQFGLPPAPVGYLDEWRTFVERLRSPHAEVKIAIVGKYVELHDAYLSIKEALVHAGVHHNVRVDMRWIHSEDLEATAPEELIGDVDGVLLCPGFGDRGLEGKIAAVRYAREGLIPYLGSCLGMQMMVVEYARHVAGMPGANTTEADVHSEFPVISMLSEQRDIESLGGTMRLGGYDTRVVPGTHAAVAYGVELVRERHRHRYEVNNALLPELQRHGLIASGWTLDGELVEIMEVRDHPFMVGSQFHPEFTSRPNRPNPLFRDFIGAAVVRSGGATGSPTSEREMLPA